MGRFAALPDVALHVVAWWFEKSVAFVCGVPGTYFVRGEEHA